MSRVGRETIKIPEQVTIDLAGERVRVRGPKGELSRVWPTGLVLNLNPGTANTGLKNPAREDDLRALWGTYNAHLKNMVNGVTIGFEKRLLVEGVGYKAAVTGEKLTLQVGFSHPVVKPIPTGLKVTIEKNLIIVSGIDRELVGQFSAGIRAVRPPDAYKEKGIRYLDEKLVKKQSSKVVAA